MSIPFNRLPNGLVEGLEYRYLPDGRIDYKSHLSAKWLRVKDDKKGDVERKYGKGADLSKVEDYFLYVMLGGYNEVARLRGFDSLTHKVDYVSDSKAVVTCTMHFIPNVEEPNGLTVSGVASGGIYNINADFTPFMETIAENRAFVRAVRRALNINIVSFEELGIDKTKNETSAAAPSEVAAFKSDIPDRPGFDPIATLSKQCKSLGVSFEQLRERAAKVKASFKKDPDLWTSFDSIDQGDVYVLMGKLGADKSTK